MTGWNTEMVGAGAALGTDIPSLSYCQKKVPLLFLHVFSFLLNVL